MPQRHLLEFFLYNPMGGLVLLVILVILVCLFIRIYLDWGTTKIMIDFSKAICIGGGGLAG